MLPLRVTDELTVDETLVVDRAVRECAQCRAALDSFSRAVVQLRATGSEPLPWEDRPTLWGRIEPRLGPAGRMRRRQLAWFSNRYLAAACVAVAILTAYAEVSRLPVESAPPPRRPATGVPSIPRREFVPLPAGGGTFAKSSQRFPATSRAGLPIYVPSDSPHYQLGLRTGDVVLTVDGRVIVRPQDLTEALSRQDRGGLFHAEVLRHGRSIPLVLRWEPQGNGAVPVKGDQ